MVIQACTTHARIIERKTEWFDQMKLCSCIGAQANDVAGVGWDFGLHENDVEHE